jgi:succinoglycan biosynthesis transport protein ExoP
MPLRPDMDYRDYIEVLGRRKWFIVVSFVAVFFGTGLYLLITPPLYKSTTTILVLPQRDIVQSGFNRRVEDRLATIQQQITSRTRLMQVREELGLFAGDKEQNQDKVYEKMQKRIELDVLEDPSSSGGGGSGSRAGFSLSYIDKDPKVAMLAAGRLASLFIEESQKTRERQASGTAN